jgi:hypothetical protein
MMATWFATQLFFSEMETKVELQLTKKPHSQGGCGGAKPLCLNKEGKTKATEDYT